MGTYNDWRPLAKDPGMKIGSVLECSAGDSTRDYLNLYLPNLQNTIYQFPACRFHNQLDESLRALGLLEFESDLKNNEIMTEFIENSKKYVNQCLPKDTPIMISPNAYSSTMHTAYS